MEDRSRRRARLVLIVGLLFAVGAGATTFFVANTAKSEAPAPIPTSSIIVAAREIPPKTQITAADLKLVKMNTEVVPPAAITRAEDAVGKITITGISVGEPILPTKLGGPNGQVFVVIPAASLGSDGNPLPGSPNYRAMSITVPDGQAAGGSIQPGDIVDVLFSFTFDPVKLNGATFVPRQGNNSYIFPGVGLGAIASGSRLVTNEMFMAAAHTLANSVSADDASSSAWQAAALTADPRSPSTAAATSWLVVATLGIQYAEL